MQGRRRGRWRRWLVVHAFAQVLRMADAQAGESASIVVRRPSASRGRGRAPGQSRRARRASSRGTVSA
eukprot:16451746-Heterocapsa_arctica.AAC.1